jgi:putative peptidoglycan lipid II flippase
MLTLARLAVIALSQWYVLTQLGLGLETDAFLAGFSLPQLGMTIIGGALAHVLVPLFTTQEEAALRQNAWLCLLVIGGSCGFIVIVLSTSAPLWVPWFVPGFSLAGKTLTVALTQIQLGSLVFSLSSLILASTYHARGRFVWVELSSLLSALVGFLGLLWSLSYYGIYAAAWIITIKALLDFVWLLPGLGRPSILSWRQSVLPTMFHRLKFLLMGSVYYGTEPLVNQILASLAPMGSLSLFYTVQQLYNVVNQVTQRAIATPMMPRLSIASAIGQWHGFRHIYRTRLGAMTTYVCIGMALLLSIGESVLHWTIGRGSITSDNVHWVWQIMVAMSGIFIGGTLGQITLSALFAMGDTRTPTRLGIMTYTLYTPLKVLVFALYGVLGLSLTVGVFVVINWLAQWYALEKLTAQAHRVEMNYAADKAVGI